MIDDKTFHNLANLARLKITPEEQALLQPQLNGIFGWIDHLQSINTDGVDPVATLNLDQMPRRLDEVKQHATQEQVLANGPDVAYGMFSVPKVVE